MCLTVLLMVWGTQNHAGETPVDVAKAAGAYRTLEALLLRDSQGCVCAYEWCVFCLLEINVALVPAPAMHQCHHRLIHH